MFLVVLTMGGLAEHGKIVEGHSLAARFTSNPIFLRHFGGGHEQQVVWPRVVLFRASSGKDCRKYLKITRWLRCDIFKQ
jgi:hypothetical protein